MHAAPEELWPPCGTVLESPGCSPGLCEDYPTGYTYDLLKMLCAYICMHMHGYVLEHSSTVAATNVSGLAYVAIHKALAGAFVVYHLWINVTASILP